MDAQGVKSMIESPLIILKPANFQQSMMIDTDEDDMMFDESVSSLYKLTDNFAVPSILDLGNYLADNCSEEHIYTLDEALDGYMTDNYDPLFYPW
jgi:hypothetical protein